MKTLRAFVAAFLLCTHVVAAPFGSISGPGRAGSGMNLNGDTTSVQTLVVGTSGTDFAISSNGTGTHTFNLPTASSTVRGALSAADWTTFNSKQNAITVLGIANGGTNSSTALSNNRVMISASGAIVEASAITASRALVSDSNGIPTHSGTTSTELGYVSGVTSAIQTQLNTKAPLASPTFSGTITTPLTASRAVVTGASSELSASSVTATELGYLSGVTGKTGTGNIVLSASPTVSGTLSAAAVTTSGAVTMSQLTASTVPYLDASKVLTSSSVTPTELGYLSGVSSAIQTQLNAKAPTASPTFSGTITTPLTASRALVTGSSSELAASATTATQIGYLSTLSSNAQDQIDSKYPTAGGTISGKVGIEAGSGSDNVLRVRGQGLISGTNQYGIYLDTIFSSGATSTGRGVTSVPSTAAATFTQNLMQAFWAGGSAGAGSTVNQYVNYYADTVTPGTTGNAALADNTSVSGNWFLNSGSGRPSLLSGTVTSTVSSGDSFVAGKSNNEPSYKLESGSNDWYLTVNSSGNFQVLNNSAASAITISQSTRAVTLPSLSAGYAVITNGSNELASSSTSSTALGYISTLSSNAQDQLDAKVADTGDTMTGQLSISMSSGPMLRIIDGGTFGSSADPHITFRDNASEGGRVGFDGSASNSISFRNLISGGSLLLQTNAAVQATFQDSSTGNQGNYSSLAPTMRLKGGLFAGASTSDYPYVGHNARSTGTGGAWEYDNADKAAIIYFQNGGIKLKTTSTTGSTGGAITFVDSVDISNSGLITLNGSSTSSTNIMVYNGRGVDFRYNANSGGYIQMNNSNTGSAAHSILYLSVGGTGAGSPVAQYVVTGGSTWTVGAQNDNGDRFIWGASSTIGSSLRMQLDPTSGDLDLMTGNLTVQTAGKSFAIKEGSNAKMGQATLSGGSVTVSTTAVTANSRIFLTSNADGGTPGFVRVSARSAGTSFTITSSSGTDTSSVAWLIIEPL